jgi:hypothetical protein
MDPGEDNRYTKEDPFGCWQTVTRGYPGRRIAADRDQPLRAPCRHVGGRTVARQSGSCCTAFASTGVWCREPRMMISNDVETGDGRD